MFTLGSRGGGRGVSGFIWEGGPSGGGCLGTFGRGGGADEEFLNM